MLASRYVQLGVSLLLVLVAANVAVLMYARTATRTGEIAVRTALGASRRRVIAQLFVEALILSAGAAAYGMTLAGVALGWVERLLTQWFSGLPFWFDLGLSGGLIAYVVGLAIVGGAIAGVLPALKVTGRKAYGGLQQLAARGSQMRLGRTWTALIVVQVGIAVAVLPTAIYVAAGLVQYGMGNPGYPAEEFFGARLSLEREEAPPSAEADAYQRAWEARFAERADALMRRLEAEPGVGVSFASASPGGGEPDRWFEIEDGVATVDPTAPATREAAVRTAFFSDSPNGTSRRTRSMPTKRSTGRDMEVAGRPTRPPISETRFAPAPMASRRGRVATAGGSSSRSSRSGSRWSTPSGSRTSRSICVSMSPSTSRASSQ